jgi:hypothetical protein
LREALGIERRIGVPLQPAFAVPVGLAVPEQEQNALAEVLFIIPPSSDIRVNLN